MEIRLYDKDTTDPDDIGKNKFHDRGFEFDGTAEWGLVNQDANGVMIFGIKTFQK